MAIWRQRHYLTQDYLCGEQVSTHTHIHTGMSVIVCWRSPVCSGIDVCISRLIGECVTSEYGGGEQVFLVCWFDRRPWAFDQMGLLLPPAGGLQGLQGKKVNRDSCYSYDCNLAITNDANLYYFFCFV